MRTHQVIRGYLSPRKVAEITNLSLSTVYRYVSLGKIPYYRIENYPIYFHQEEIAAWIGMTPLSCGYDPAMVDTDFRRTGLAKPMALNPLDRDLEANHER